MSLFDTIFNDHAIPAMTDVFGGSVIAWESGDQRVTAIRLSTGQSFSDALFEEFQSEKDVTSGMSNKVSGRLWIPVSAEVKQQEQWLLIRSDNSQVEVTVSSFGKRVGGKKEVVVEQLTITRYGSQPFAGR